MKNEFETLARFLEKYGPEVEGHAFDEMPTDLKLKLRRFAKGNLGAAEREELATLLRDHPRWVGVLAQEAKRAGAA
jgi:2-oxo-4-hydroxy-4-carboxy--5-ureidoimidazoline (OHCU) decarboxylase